MSLYDRLSRRELGITPSRTSWHGLYGERKWIKDLDICNELSGHRGCVNALSWSKNGQLLATGSDDTRVNIHRYLPDDTINPFSHSTSIETGHTANIFSVKFMPHSNDRTVVSCAGDAQIRIFDIEYSGRSIVHAEAGMPSRARLLTEGDTNARVYRSHSDRVKRIVTESSPFLFLTCSEDGEVRQWDLRQPSSAYPRPRNAGLRWGAVQSSWDDGPVPPPLISYKRQHIDLNTISCSASQPHYIALGGAHLHCFLHDRRMLGRDTNAERGGKAKLDDDGISNATQCVRRFAPKGQARLKHTEHGHITACKISDAHPNSLVVSWSSDSIYHFNMTSDPGVTGRPAKRPGFTTSSGQARVRADKDKKRRRTATGSTTSNDAQERASPRERLSHEDLNSTEGSRRLRINYENGQSETILLADDSDDSDHDLHRESDNEEEKLALKIASGLDKICKGIFLPLPQTPEATAPVPWREFNFSPALEAAAAVIEHMDEAIRNWRYPVNPTETQAAAHRLLRKKRERARRLVQACGTLSRLLGGTLPSNDAAKARHFIAIRPAPNESRPESDEEEHELFRYDFIKAIVLWLDSGPGGLLEGFTAKRHIPGGNPRLPVPEGSGIEAIEDCLIQSLLHRASSSPILRVGSSPFEVTDRRYLAMNERAAVSAFGQAVGVPFADLSSAHEEPGRQSVRQDRKEAILRWGQEYARGILLQLAGELGFKDPFHAFGGSSFPRTLSDAEAALREQVHGIASDDESADDAVVSNIVASDDGEDFVVTADDLGAVLESEYEDDDGESEDDDEDEDDDESGEDSDESERTHILMRSAWERSTLRSNVQLGVPCVAATRQYSGHANVRTVKDVNFFGKDDEYVVSGSDTGHLFIWETASGRLVNILEGDGEVVNVITGHPFEPMLAVSGIDHTVKIFSPDKRLQRDARRGVGVQAREDANRFSSLDITGRRQSQRRADATEEEPLLGEEGSEADDAPHGISSDESEHEDWFTVPGNNSAPGTSAQDPATDGVYSDYLIRGNHLQTRRSWHEADAILAQNRAEVSSSGGGQQTFITRGMLAALARRMQSARGDGLENNDDDDVAEDGEEIEVAGGRVVITDDCTLM